MTASRRVVVRGAGGPEVLHVEAWVAPPPRRHQVRIRTALAGVAFGDVMRRVGVLAPPRPFTPGYDLVGRIDAVGPGVDPQRIGTRVLAMTRPTGFGGYADHVCVTAAAAVPVPDGLDDATALGLGLNYVTAWQILHRQLRLERGASLLVHGAAGGVGTALLDLGSRAGLELFGTASAGKHEALRARGAVPIDYRTEDFVARISDLTGVGVDAVTDPIGGAHLARSAQAVRPGGTVVFFGLTGDAANGLGAVARGLGTVLRVWASGRCRLRPYGVGIPPVSTQARCIEDQHTLLALGLEGLAPEIADVVPLDEVRDAHRRLDASRVTGKLLLRCA